MDLLGHAKNFLANKIADFPKPQATVDDVDLKGFGLDGLSFLAKVSVSNPYAVPIPIPEISYNFYSANHSVATGSIPDPGSLKANGHTVLDVTIKVPHSAIISLIRDVSADWDIDYKLELGLIIDLPLIGNVTIPISYTGEFKLPTFADFFRAGSKEKEKKEEKKNKEEEEKMKEKEKVQIRSRL